MDERQTLLLELIGNPKCCSELMQRLARHMEECEHHLAEVTKLDVLRVFKQLRSGELDAGEIEIWARSLHGRNDVGYEFGDAGAVEEAMFWLANPALNWPIDEALHQRIVNLFERRSRKRD